MAELWHPGSPPVTAAELPTILAGHPVVVIHFWAAWNGVDRLFAPKLAAVHREYQGRIALYSVDVDERELVAFCRECEVGNVPALACFVGGERIKTIIGARSEDQLRAEFRGLLTRSGDAQSGSPVPRAKQWWRFWK